MKQIHNPSNWNFTPCIYNIHTLCLYICSIHTYLDLPRTKRHKLDIFGRSRYIIYYNYSQVGFSPAIFFQNSAVSRKVGHVSEELEVYVPMGSANGETILFRGKVACLVNFASEFVTFLGWLYIKPLVGCPRP